MTLSKLSNGKGDYSIPPINLKKCHSGYCLNLRALLSAYNVNICDTANPSKEFCVLDK